MHSSAINYESFLILNNFPLSDNFSSTLIYKLSFEHAEAATGGVL